MKAVSAYDGSSIILILITHYIFITIIFLLDMQVVLLIHATLGEQNKITFLSKKINKFALTSFIIERIKWHVTQME